MHRGSNPRWGAGPVAGQAVPSPQQPDRPSPQENSLSSAGLRLRGPSGDSPTAGWPGPLETITVEPAERGFDDAKEIRLPLPEKCSCVFASVSRDRRNSALSRLVRQTSRGGHQQSYNRPPVRKRPCVRDCISDAARCDNSSFGLVLLVFRSHS